MLDSEGFGGPGDLAIIGSAAEVTDRIRALADCGVTTATAAAFGTQAELEATGAALITLV
ncbi:MAG: 5,10-methylenetetrahydromethanopterin reductase [Candidatus Poriferisodalaceae bacterium]|jgi:5,10-methylenetetrahydromethanopterin reductase